MNTEQTPRPLFVLLPIARKYLCQTLEQIYSPEQWSPYTCNAAQIAHHQEPQELSAVEYSLLKNAICDQLWYAGYKYSTLFSYLRDSEQLDDSIDDSHSLAYFAVRDAWLDKLQYSFITAGV